MVNSTPVVIDCFAGAGGLSLGLQQAGFTLGSAFDFTPQAVKTYARNLSQHILEARVEDLTGEVLLQAAGLQKGQVALVAGGPPCQGFSRQRRGTDDDVRNDLVFELLRIVREVKPEMFLMENVGAIQGRRGTDLMKRFIIEASDAGYHIMIKVLDAADFGVPQHRKRAFIVGERTDKAPTFVFPEPTHMDCKVTVRDAFAGLPEPSDREASVNFTNHEKDNISELNRLRISHVPEGGGRADLPEHLRLPCHRVDVDKAGHRGVFGRLWWDKPSGTITTKSNSFTRGRFAHPVENRNITMREAARLQGFPDNFEFLGNKVDVAHQVGNAVPPPLAYHLGCALREALERRSCIVGPNKFVQPSLFSDF